MARILFGRFALLACLCLVISCGKRQSVDYSPPPGVSWSSVLQYATDPGTIAEPVEAWERSRHFSSSADDGKVMLAGLAPEIMGDMDHGFFLDVKEHADGVDATLAEVHGKGMATWMWSANPAGTLRLFIDDETTPVVEMPFHDFLRGTFLPVRYPFSAFTAGGYNLHFPILHERYLKVVIRMPSKKDLASLYYQVAWNAVNPTQDVHPFSMEDVARGSVLLKECAGRWMHPPDNPDALEFKTIQLKPGQTMELFTSATAGTIHELRFRTDRRADLFHLHLAAYWDDAIEPDLNSPLYLLAGTSERMEDVTSMAASVRGASAHIRWPMPFQSARLVVGNTSSEPIRLTYGIRVSKQTGAMRLSGTRVLHEGLSTERKNILTFAEVTGAGRLVACTIQVESRTDAWWGEGDQHMYLDSTVSPTWQGTGTEDYFGFAWCSTTSFNHPVRGQSSVRDRRTGRVSAMHRYHLLDRLPFHEFAKFNSEALGMAEGTMDYEALVLYYVEKETPRYLDVRSR